MLLLATEVWKSHGGIQRYMRIVTRILANRDDRLTVLTLLDDDIHRPDEFAGFSAICCNGSKWKFCAQALRLAKKGAAETSVVGHVALAPVAWILHVLGLIQHYVVILHGIEAWHRVPWIYRAAIRRAATTIATTRYTAREFCFFNGLPAAKCITIPLACGFRQPAARPAAPAANIRILTVCRLSASEGYKGVDTVLHAMRLACDRELTVTVEVVGEGDDRRRLEDLSRSLGIDALVHFHGSVSDEELGRLFSQSHIFVMPSRKEGFGIVFLEAMSAGLPCIGANHGGTPEVIDHGESGFLIEYGDVAQLAFYLGEFLAAPGLYDKMSNAARRRAPETPECDLMGRAWRDLADRFQKADNPGPRSQQVAAAGTDR